MRFEAAKTLKMETVPIIFMEGLTEAQKRAIAIKDNGAWGEWDFDILATKWADLPLSDWGVELPKGWLSTGEVVEDDFDAQAEAEQIKIKGEALKLYPQIIQLEFIQKMAPNINWGILPEGVLPFLDLAKISGGFGVTQDIQSSVTDSTTTTTIFEEPTTTLE